MLGGKSTAYGDALGCGVGYGAAPSPQFLPQADIWPLRTPPCPKPTAPPLRVWSGHRTARKRLQSAPPDGVYAPPHSTKIASFAFFSAPGGYVAFGWARMGSWGAMSYAPISATRTPPQADWVWGHPSPFLTPLAASPTPQPVGRRCGLTASAAQRSRTALAVARTAHAGSITACDRPPALSAI